MVDIAPALVISDIEIIRGDTYESAISRAITWTDTNNVWPDLATALSITFTRDSFSKAVMVISPAPNQVLQLELTASESDSLNCIKDSYNIKATLLGGEICTLALGKFIVRDAA